MPRREPALLVGRPAGRCSRRARTGRARSSPPSGSAPSGRRRAPRRAGRRRRAGPPRTARPRRGPAAAAYRPTGPPTTSLAAATTGSLRLGGRAGRRAPAWSQLRRPAVRRAVARPARRRAPARSTLPAAPWSARLAGSSPSRVAASLGVGEVVVLLGDGFCVDVVLLAARGAARAGRAAGRRGARAAGRRRRLRRGGGLRVVDGVVVGVGTLLSPTPARAGKSTVLVPSRAPSMKAVQILAGNVPPVSSPKPAMFCIGLRLAVDVVVDADRAVSCGMNPANQTDLFSVDVPVLPAAGRPSASGAVRRCPR